MEVKKRQTGSALLVIDVQQGLFEKGTPIYQAEVVLVNINALIARARESAAPVVFIQHADPRGMPEGSSAWQLHPALQQRKGDLYMGKTISNAFDDSPLDGLLRGRGINAVVACGLVTHACVKNTCLGALDLGYAVTLAADAHSNYSKDAAAIIAKWHQKLEEKGCTLLPTAAITFA